MNENVDLFSNVLNHAMTSGVLRHWFSLVLARTILLMFSRICLLTRPRLFLAGLISLHIGLLQKTNPTCIK